MLIAACNVATWTAAGPVVNLGYAKYEGSFNETGLETSRFLGIRYAAPPTGSLRWQPPKAPAYTPYVVKADNKPPRCPQAGWGTQTSSPFQNSIGLGKRRHALQSEDCLFLNVFTPGELSSDRKFPVVVWIHGGGYTEGDVSWADGDNLIMESNGGIVVVTIQYRLGLFGFLSGNEIKENGALNAGLLDQQFALQWVHKFNGDPTRVTIWGESAGAGSVLQHIVANGGKTSPPLFQSAITSSTFLPSQYQYNDQIPQTLYDEVVAQSNCSSASDTLHCLRKVDTLSLANINANVTNRGLYGTFTFAPVVDGCLIQERPSQALQKRKINGNNILAVTNTLEGAIFIDPETSADVDVANYVTQLFPTFTSSESDAVVSKYKAFGPPLSQVGAIMGEYRGFKAEFAIPPGHHADDIPYYFPSYEPPAYDDPRFIAAFSHTFTDFALTHNPNNKSSPTITPMWGAWAGQREMLFNKTRTNVPDIRIVKTSPGLLERCQ
ncbi:hypothetical protein H0H92_002694 [Tricholoma furcatifolium]|nr:hypothetical protein H0H92_002694 [Tricholoma furcatifolium]